MFHILTLGELGDPRVNRDYCGENTFETALSVASFCYSHKTVKYEACNNHTSSIGNFITKDGPWARNAENNHVYLVKQVSEFNMIKTFVYRNLRFEWVNFEETKKRLEYIGSEFVNILKEANKIAKGPTNSKSNGLSCWK